MNNGHDVLSSLMAQTESREKELIFIFFSSQTGKNVTKDSDKPKRNPTAYFIFLSDFRKKMANQKLPDGQKIPSLAGEKWRTMSDKDKEPYLKEEAKEKAKYEEAMKEYRKMV